MMDKYRYEIAKELLPIILDDGLRNPRSIVSFAKRINKSIPVMQAEMAVERADALLAALGYVRPAGE